MNILAHTFPTVHRKTGGTHSFPSRVPQVYFSVSGGIPGPVAQRGPPQSSDTGGRRRPLRPQSIEEFPEYPKQIPDPRAEITTQTQNKTASNSLARGYVLISWVDREAPAKALGRKDRN